MMHRHVTATGQEQFKLDGSGLSLQQQQRAQVTHWPETYTLEHHTKPTPILVKLQYATLFYNPTSRVMSQLSKKN